MIDISPNKYTFDETELDKFENELGVILPQSYKHFLQKYNGGTPEPNIIELKNEEIKSISITDFFGVKNAQINDLKFQYEIYKERIPNKHIPISRVEGGNIICLGLENHYISLWDHDTELLNADIKPNNPLIYIEKNFEKFIEKIKPMKENMDLQDYKVRDIWVAPDFLNELNEDK